MRKFCLPPSVFGALARRRQRGLRPVSLILDYALGLRSIAKTVRWAKEGRWVSVLAVIAITMLLGALRAHRAAA
jgi:hypothetical protein